MHLRSITTVYFDTRDFGVSEQHNSVCIMSLKRILSKHRVASTQLLKQAFYSTFSSFLQLKTYIRIPHRLIRCLIECSRFYWNLR